MRRKRMLGALGCALLAGPMYMTELVAQDTPIDARGTQVGTEETAAASTTTSDLQKAVQNPVASLISVPIQNNSNFGVGAFDRIQDVLNI